VANWTSGRRDITSSLAGRKIEIIEWVHGWRVLGSKERWTWGDDSSVGHVGFTKARSLEFVHGCSKG
jgi:hypothetical protein